MNGTPTMPHPSSEEPTRPGDRVATVRDELERAGYVRDERLIDPSMAGLLYEMFKLHHWRGEFARDDQLPDAVSFTHHSALDAVLLGARERVEDVSGCRLLPTYAYGRLYLHGNVLTPHRDRPACEVSASVHLGHDGGDPALWFEPDHRVELDVGDGVVYLGITTSHWRDRFEGTSHGQLFLHYVQEEGGFADHRLDRRPNRFPPSALRRRAL
jgi:hypothetical protein